MFCPYCGNKMIESKLNQNLKRIELICPKNGCFKEDYPLYYHQAWQGYDSRPGDSWSLTWLK